MKKFRNLLLVLSVVLLGACTETRIAKEELVADVAFDLITNSDIDITTKSISVNRDADVPVPVKSLTITATNGTDVKSEIFDFVDAGGVDGILMENLLYGVTTFDAVTSSYDYETLLAQGEFDTLSTDNVGNYGKVGDVMFGVTKKFTPTEVSDFLRNLTPYAVFNGTVDADVDGSDINVPLTMTTNHGRIIMTITYDGVNSYTSEILNNGTTIDFNESRGASVPQKGINKGETAWLLWTGADVLEDEMLPLTYQIISNSGQVIGVTGGFTADIFKVVGGKDTWINIIIKDTNVFSPSKKSFDFTWEWEEEDHDIILE